MSAASPRAVAALLSLWLSACEASNAPPPTPSPDDEPAPSSVASARRPGRRFLMQRVGTRCELRHESLEGERVVAPARVACPRDLEEGEQIRLTGKTCIREGGPSGAQLPVGCPDALLELEASVRAAAPLGSR